MITAETLKTLIGFTPEALARALAVSGYKGAQFKSSKFLGITNGGQFCYGVTFYDEEGMGEGQGKVFLTYDPAAGKVTAGY